MLSYLIRYTREVLMECITAWWHVVKVSSSVKEEGESCSIHSCVIFRYTIEEDHQAVMHSISTSFV